MSFLQIFAQSATLSLISEEILVVHGIRAHPVVGPDRMSKAHSGFFLSIRPIANVAADGPGSVFRTYRQNIAQVGQQSAACHTHGADGGQDARHIGGTIMYVMADGDDFSVPTP